MEQRAAARLGEDASAYADQAAGWNQEVDACATVGAVLATIAVPALEATFDGSAGFTKELLEFYQQHAWKIAAALAVFEAGGFRQLVGTAVAAADLRAKELAGPATTPTSSTPA